jgi:hypothetical protein
MLAPISDNESTVYGFIRDSVILSPESDAPSRLATNRGVLLNLPDFNACTLLYRDMFSIPSSAVNAGGFYSSMIHFGAPYDRVEYEWESWLDAFEEILTGMFWVNAVVHLETPSSGTHTYLWESSEMFHVPGSRAFEMRCEWVRGKGFYEQADYV